MKTRFFLHPLNHIILLILVFALLFSGCKSGTTETKTDSMTVAEAMADSDTAGYAQVIEPRTFSFPVDHGPHPDFKTEWWYVTGNLSDESQQEYGFQFTLFRSAMSPKDTEKSSLWATRQLYMGHFTITDLQNKTFTFEERFARAANGLAGAQTHPPKAWLENWSFELLDTVSALTTFDMRATLENAGLNLNLKALKPIVLQGEGGLSQKGPEPGNASYYYSLTRLQATGTMAINNQTKPVTGQAWLDREWSTSALSQNQVGWDWFSLQLDDNREIMYYQLRQKDGSADSLSKGAFVSPEGTYRKITSSEVRLTVLDQWESPLGGVYPSGWELEIPAENLSLTITPKLKSQELDVQIRYWEGSVQVSGLSKGKPITGRGYVELTGYATDQPK